MNIKNCKECGKEFLPSSRHVKCNKCRRQSYNNCHCGKEKTRAAFQCNECRLIANTKASGWRGNSIYHKKGYVLVRFPDHPNSVTGYVFEHRLVMEDYLGRYLLPHENIHHKNGIKDDNRLENLELWTKPQPTGARAEDLLAWAKEIIDLYSNKFPIPTNFNA